VEGWKEGWKEGWRGGNRKYLQCVFVVMLIEGKKNKYEAYVSIWKGRKKKGKARGYINCASKILTGNANEKQGKSRTTEKSCTASDNQELEKREEINKLGRDECIPGTTLHACNRVSILGISCTHFRIQISTSHLDKAGSQSNNICIDQLCSRDAFASF
jgi:hypothetical protein